MVHSYNMRRYFGLFLLASLAAAAKAQWPRCEKISSPICQHLGYNTTLMPNFVGHSDQQQAVKGLQEFQPLLQYNCSQHLRLFVCSVFMPLCSEHVPGAVPACQGLCEVVREDCLPVLESFNLPWPAELDCARFPAPPALCMQLPSNEEVDHLHVNASFLTVEVPVSAAFSHCPPRFASVEDSCSPLCDSDAYYRSDDKKFTELWTNIWGCISLIMCTFTILTFFMDRTRFPYPEKPVIFLAFSCLIYSCLILLKSILGSNIFVCGSGHLATKPLDNSLCALSSVALHYLRLVSQMWWVIFCACWYLHAACEWSNEALIELSPWFHGVVYGVAVIPVLLALVTGQIEADELTGTCAIKEKSTVWFVVVPHILCLLIGGLLAVGTAVALVRVRRALKAAGRGAYKLDRLMVRLGLFTLLFILPEISYLICTIYESWHRPWWKSLALLSALDCRTHHNCSPEPAYHTASIEVVLLRTMFSLTAGVSSLLWVCSGKTCRTWGRMLHTPQKFMPITKV